MTSRISTEHIELGQVTSMVAENSHTGIFAVGSIYSPKFSEDSRAI